MDRLPAQLLKWGLLKLEVDLQRTIVDFWPTPFTVFRTCAANIECKMSSPQTMDKFNQTGVLDALDFKFESMSVALKNQGNGVEHISFRAGTEIHSIKLVSTIEISTGDKSGPTSFLEGTLWKFEASNSNTHVTDMAKIWSATPNLLPTDQDVPFTKAKASELKGSTAGFILCQPVAGVAKYDLYSIYMSTALEDWKAFLPDGFPSVDSGVETAIDIRNPLQK